MRIQFSVVGQVEPYGPVFVDMPVAPRVGETIKLPGLEEYETLVRAVVWYPIVNDEGKPKLAINNDPDVYIVLGGARPEWSLPSGE